MSTALPIHEIKTPVINAWREGGCIVGAPPGSGKTTVLPLWLLEQQANRVYLLIPKRLAVKLAAAQLAQNLGEKVGERVGVRLRNETVQSEKTQLIVTTYGSFLRALINDPDEISGSTVIFDEFHERGIDQDLCYALINQYVNDLDDSVRRIVMSATLNLTNIQQQTGLPLVESAGFSYPVTIEYRKIDTSRADKTSEIVSQYWHQSDDHILVFFPGLKEMRAVERQLADDIPVLLLHSQLNQSMRLSDLEQAPPTVILASNIAESSITLPRVHTVIDTGTERFATTHPVSGINELATRRISKASAKQRAGRAGRLGPGLAVRLWSEDEHQVLVDHQPAELHSADLSSTALQSAQWGSDGTDLPWLERPNARRWQLARQRLRDWRALDDNGQLTEHGQQMAKAGLEPWLAHLLTTAQAEACFEAAVWLAAHLTLNQPIEYDPLSCTSGDSFSAAIHKEAQHICRQFSTQLSASFEPLTVPALIKTLPERLVHWQTPQQGQLISGTSVFSQQRHEPGSWAVMLDGIRQGNQINCYQSVGIQTRELFDILPPQEEISFHPNSKPAFRLTEKLGNIVLSSQACAASPEQKRQAWTNHLRQQGEQAMPWCERSKDIRARWLFAVRTTPSWPGWPDDDQWAVHCEPFLAGISRFEEISTFQVLQHTLGYEMLQELEKQFFRTWQAPSGRNVVLTYDDQEGHVTASLKLQEMFGATSQPRLPGGMPIRLSLNAPNGRPVAMVTDLRHFWQQTYPQIRKELRGRYAKHPWPEDPLQCEPTLQTNRQIRLQS